MAKVTAVFTKPRPSLCFQLLSLLIRLMRHPNRTTQPPYLEKQQQKTNIDQQTQYPDPHEAEHSQTTTLSIFGNDFFSL
jgi:hypothetical protein